MEYETED